MSETIISKKCCTCNQIKPIKEFWKNKSTKDGLQKRCIVCHKKAMKIWYAKPSSKKICYESVKRYRKTKKYQLSKEKWIRSESGKNSHKKAMAKYCKNNQEKRIAKNAVAVAVTKGDIPHIKTQTCKCGKQAQHYHHYIDYTPTHWLDVKPVCIKCHKAISPL